MPTHLTGDSPELRAPRPPLPVLVVGGVNLDIEGRPIDPLNERDSNPGTVHLSRGGSGRNVAENLARMGLEVELVAAVGADRFGQNLVEGTQATGVGTSGVEVIEGESTSCYLSILDAEGDMALAVSGMGIYDHFTPERALKAVERSIEAAEKAHPIERPCPFSALVIDGNLRPDTAEAVLNRFRGIPAWFDPVSTHKAARFAGYKGGALLSSLSFAKPNLAEAQAMAGALLTGSPYQETPGQNGSNAVESARSIVRFLHSRGLPFAMVSLGNEGLLWSDGFRCHLVRPREVQVVSATGAGDAFLAGALRSTLVFLASPSPDMVAAAGCAASVLTLADPEAVAKTMSGPNLDSLLTLWQKEQSVEIVTFEEKEQVS